jgi:hypothetical protein
MRRYRFSIQAAEGNIMAFIMTSHMPRNDAAASAHVCSGIRIHVIDIVHPPGIAMDPISDMDRHQMTAEAALVMKSSPAAPRKVCSEAR